jgi:hypothetical protein
MTGRFIDKTAHFVRNIGIFMSYILSKLGTIGKTIFHVADGLDSVMGM